MILRWGIIGLIALYCTVVLVRCAPEPPPPPAEELPLPPVPPTSMVPITHDHVGRLQTSYDEATARLRVYRALPPCVPSGPVQCREEEILSSLVAKQIEASQAIRTVRQTRMLRVRSKTKIQEFDASTRRLNVKEIP